MMIGVMRKKKKRDVREEEEGIFKVAEEGLLKINLMEKTSVLGMLLILLNRRKKIWRIYI